MHPYVWAGLLGSDVAEAQGDAATSLVSFQVLKVSQFTRTSKARLILAARQLTLPSCIRCCNAQEWGVLCRTAQASPSPAAAPLFARRLLWANTDYAERKHRMQEAAFVQAKQNANQKHA
eukprot:6180182-Pleurochrysis_carterae.AAC.1